jgi:hypothetical protein
MKPARMKLGSVLAAGLSLAFAASVGCGHPPAEMALVMLDVDTGMPSLTRVVFSVTDPSGVPVRTVMNPMRMFRFGYYLPGVNGSVTIEGRAFLNNCVVAESSVTVPGVRVGSTTAGGKLVLSAPAQPICGDAGTDDGGPEDDGGTGSGGAGAGGTGGDGSGGGGGPGSGGSGGTASGGSGTGGRGPGGAGSGGAGTGGSGATGTGGGGTAGRSGTGGAATGGAATGGRGTGGAATGGAATGGAATGGAATGGAATGGAATGGAATGGRGTGGMGTGGALITVAELFPAGASGSLDGRLMTVPCNESNPTGTDCQSAGVYSQGVLYACSAAPINVVQNFPVAGTPGARYVVALHFYGIVGPKNYGPSVVREASSRPGSQDTGASPTPFATAPAGHAYPGSDYETYEIRVLNQTGQEEAVYYLNADTSEGHFTYVLNFEKLIDVIGGGTVRLRYYDNNCRIIKNCGPSGTAASQCAATANRRVIDVSAANPAPAAAPANEFGLLQPNLSTARGAEASGQWLLIDVVRVVSMI